MRMHLSLRVTINSRLDLGIALSVIHEAVLIGLGLVHAHLFPAAVCLGSVVYRAHFVVGCVSFVVVAGGVVVVDSEDEG